MSNMIMRNKNGVLVWNDDTPVFEMGMMFVELFEHTANDNGFAWGYNPTTNVWNVINPPTVEFINGQLDLLARDGWRVIRCRAIPMSYPNKFTESWGAASEYGTTAYWERVDATWDKMEQMMDHAASLGIGIMFDFWGSTTAFADYLWQADSTVRISDWGNTSSSLFLKAKEITQRFVSRFANHPAVSAWEVMGEWDGESWYKVIPNHSNEPSSKGYRTDYSNPDDLLSDTDLITYQTAMVAAIRDVDSTGRFIGSGSFGQKDIQRDDKFFDRYFALQEMTDGASIHHYENMPMGNRDYSAFKDGLVLHRKQAYQRGLVSYIGEHGIANDIIYLGRPSSYYTDIEYDAIIDAGIQLSFHWNWMGTPGGIDWKPSARGVHPEIDWPTIPGQYQMLLSKLEKIRNTEWYRPDVMPFKQNIDYVPTEIVSTDGTNKYKIYPNERNDNGLTLAFWYNPIKGAPWGQAVMLSSFVSSGNSTALGDYRFPEGDNGWFFRQTYTGIDFGIRLSDGTLKYTGGYTYEIEPGTSTVTEGNVWTHFCIQIVNPTEDWTNDYSEGPHQAPGLRIHVNGVMKSYIYLYDGNNPWVPATSVDPTAGIVIGGLNETYLEDIETTMGRATGQIAGISEFNRPLKDSEVYNLYYNNEVPAGTMSSYWELNGPGLQDAISGRDADVIMGSWQSNPNYNNIPTTAYPGVTKPVTSEVTTNTGATLQLRRGDSAYVNSYTGPEGELVVNTETKKVHVQDGVTIGGFDISRPIGKQTRPFAQSSKLMFNGNYVDSTGKTVSEVVYVLNDLSDIYNDAKTLKSNGATLVTIRVNLNGYDMVAITNAIKILKLEKISTLLRLENGTSVTSAVNAFKGVDGVAGWVTSTLASEVSALDNRAIITNSAVTTLDDAVGLLASGDSQIVMLEYYGISNIHADTSSDLMTNVRRINDKIRSENRGL